MSRGQEIDIVCSAATGAPYTGGHHLFSRHFTVIEATGTVKRFCDADCVRRHYAYLRRQAAEGPDRAWDEPLQVEGAEPGVVDPGRLEAEEDVCRCTGCSTTRWEDGNGTGAPTITPPPPPPVAPSPTLVLARATDAVPEGSFSPEIPGLDRLEWEARAQAAGAASWEAIGPRPATLGWRWSRTMHVFRTAPRGSGKKRHLWSQTTECGQIAEPGGRWVVRIGILAATTCLTCRTVVRERYERYERDEDADAVADAYDQQQWESQWAIQAAWHAPDPVARA